MVDTSEIVSGSEEEVRQLINRCLVGLGKELDYF